MLLEQAYVFSVIIAMLVGLVFNLARPAWLFSLAALALYFPGFVSADRFFSHAVNPAVLTLVLLLVCSIALERTRALAWVSKQLFSKSQFVTLTKMGGLVAASSAFLNNTAIVASLMGAVRNNSSQSAKRLLIPLSYFAILGGTLTLIGTSTNLVVNSFLVDYGKAGFNFFDFLPVGLVILLVCGIAVIIVSYWLPKDNIADTVTREYFLEAKIDSDSTLIGKSLYQAGLITITGLDLVEVVRKDQVIASVEHDLELAEGDQLIYCGDVKLAKQLASIKGLSVFAEDSGLLDKHLKEVIVSPMSTLIGRTLKQSSFRAHFDAAVVAIGRNGGRLSGALGEVEIRAGDKLVIATGRDFYKRPNIERNFIFLDKVRLHPPLKISQEIITFTGFFLAVASAALGFVDLLTALIAYLILIFATKVISATEVRRRLPLDIWLVIASALAIADVFNQVGVANLIANGVTGLFHIESSNDITGIYLSFISIYLLTWLITEMVTNNAAAALMFPIAFGLAESIGVNYMPYVMAVAYGASASFISPYGYQTNLMVMNAGGYSFKDFAKVGWLVSLCFTIVALLMIPIVFPFS